MSDHNSTISTSSFIGDPLTKFIAEQRAQHMPQVDHNGRAINPSAPVEKTTKSDAAADQ
jgi:hypothetical protein